VAPVKTVAKPASVVNTAPLEASDSVETVVPMETASTSNTDVFTPDTPKITKLVMKLSGGTLTERQADYVLLVFVVAIMLLSLYLFLGV